MVQVTWKGTWKGEDSDQDEITFRRVTLKKGAATEVTDLEIVRKVKNSSDFVVDPPDWAGGPGGPGTGIVNGDPPLHPAPSAVSAQYPVAKPGEPIQIEPKEPEPTPQKTKLKPIPKVAAK